MKLRLRGTHYNEGHGLGMRGSTRVGAPQGECMLETIFDPKTCRRRGHCQIVPDSPTETPQTLYYEVHGSEDPSATKLVFVMGLNASSFAWRSQVAFFASQGNNFSILVYDNRGSGNSSAPGGFYSTKAMARDGVALLDHLGWNAERSLVVVGASMGGMISMDLARLIPSRISTLVLSSTKSGYRWNYPTLRTIWIMARFLFGTVWTARQSLRLTLGLMYPKEFMNKIYEGESSGGGGRTGWEVIEQEWLRRISLSGKGSLRGYIGQMAAVLRHRMRAEELAELARTIPKIAIIQGDGDRIVRPADARILHRMLPGSEFTVCPGVGHGLTLQIGDYFNQWLVTVIEDGRSTIGMSTGGASQR